ncbi:MAG: zinc ribbon domain-containing protein [Ignavibacteria bacterium]|nr:zinc ribbon domain-containing protein [Ignavibacteria bacterium]
MPIFEYKCNDCNTKFEIFHKSRENEENIFCPKCNSKNYKKLISVFSSFGSENDTDFDNPCSSGYCDTSYNGGCPGGVCGLN